MPKGAMRILNAGKVQAEYNKRKRQPAEDTGPAQRGGPTAAQKGKGKAKAEAKNDSNAELKIRPGEKLGDFNR